MPLGCLAGGLVKEYGFSWMIINLVPVIIVVLIFIPKIMLIGFMCFGKLVMLVLTIGLIATGTVITPGMAPITEAFQIVSAP